MAKQLNTLKSNTFRDEVQTEPQPDVKLPADEKKSGKKKPSKPEKPVRAAKPKIEKEKKEKKPADERKLKVLGLFLLLVGAYLLLAFSSYTQTWKVDYDYASKVLNGFTFDHFANSETPENWTGKIGAITGFLFISQLFGVSAFLLIVMLAVSGVKLIFTLPSFHVGPAFKYSFFGLVWTPVTLSVLFPGEDLLYGVYGYRANLLLTDFLGYSGMVLLLVFLFLSLLTLSFNIPFRWFKASEKKRIDVTGTGATPPVVVPEPPVSSYPELEIEEELPENIFRPDTKLSENILNGEEPETDFVFEDQKPVQQDEPRADTLAGNEPDIEFTVEKVVPEIVAEETSAVPLSGGHFGLDTKYDPTLDLPHYKLPPLDLLNDYGGDEINVNKDELEANKNRIVETLRNYSIKIQKIKATIGPAVTLYEIIPEAGVRISKIKNLEDDIALSLSALGIRIIAPIPGKGTIGIEVPNKNPETVSIRSLLSSEKFQKTTYELPLVLGKTISNETYLVDLVKMPHILMAGATGQGKSVGLNTIITSLLYKKHPSQVKFVMIDPKKVELSLFSKIERHYLAKLPDSDEAIITDTKKVIRTLNSLNVEMDSRYDLLQDAQVRNIKEYNDKFISRKLNPGNGHHYLPYLIVVVDEFADLIMTAGREIETPLTRLAQLARAVGIHLVIATQRPSVNIITGTIKANFPARIAFRVISKIDSRTILDSGGADQLVGRGDMLLLSGSDLTRVQCAFVDTPEIEKITEFIGSQRGFSDAYHLPEFNDEEADPKLEMDPDSRDELFLEAARLIVQSQQGSTSLLQRKLKLGYNRAGRIIDQLESAGIVGQFEGSKAREVKFRDLTSLEIHLREIGEAV